MGDRRSGYTVFVGKPLGKRTLGRPRRTWGDNTKTDFQEVRCGARTGWIRLGIGTGYEIL
jgi:hypothetical protein